MTINAAKEFMSNEITEFVAQHSPKMGLLLELTLMQITFMQMFRESTDDKELYNMVQLHTMKTLEVSAFMADISEVDIDAVVSKSIELVDCMGAIADPTRTNLH